MTDTVEGRKKEGKERRRKLVNSFKKNFILTYPFMQLAMRIFRILFRRPKFNPWGGRMLWRREWQPTPVFLPGEFHEQRSLAGYSP